MPAARSNPENWKVQLSLKRGNDMVNLRGDTVGEVADLLADLAENEDLEHFAKEEATRPTGGQDRGRSTRAGSGAGRGRARSARRGGNRQEPEVVEEGGCPEDGGDLVKRDRRDGSGSFIGCGNYPDCTYIENE